MATTTVTKLFINNNILSGSSSTLVSTANQTRNFGIDGDYVEMNVYNLEDIFLFQLSPFNNYKLPGTFVDDTTLVQELEFNPGQDLTNFGINNGVYKTEYNILRPKIINNSNRIFFIKEISPDRTEIRLSTNNIPNDVLNQGALEFINEFQSLGYFKEFYVNVGQGVLLPAINIALDENTIPSSLLIKLLNPLPPEVDISALVSIVDKISNTQLFQVNITPDPVVITYPSLRGPNFDLELDNIRTNPTNYYNYNQISGSNVINTQLQSLLGLISSSQFQINVDYTDYNNFIHYSSAQQRLDGFYYKLSNIELYTSASSSAAAAGNITSQLDAINYKNKIDSVIQSFDGYEQYLYYESESYAWPKSNSTKPYINYSTSSVAGNNWYISQSISASDYDANNQNNLIYTLPTYVNENDNNDYLFKFINSMGQMFDDIWIHIKAITDLYQAKNSLTEGISKDLVYYALQSMGIDVYTDQDGTSVFRYLYGVNPDGTYLPVTSSYQTLVSASQYQMSGQDIQKGIYKRMYHSLPLLLKSKGTTRFIQYLNTVFGIPTTIMSYIEYGGVDKVTSSFEYEYDRYTYALNLSGSNTVSIPWVYTSQSLARTGSNDITPNGIEFRFKTFTTASNILLSTYPTQSLFYNSTNYNLYLLYNETGSSNSIYSGSVGKFGYLQFNLGGLSVTSSTVPVFMTGSDGETDWYTVLIQRRIPDLTLSQTGSSQIYDVYIKNNVWGELGHIASASLTTNTPSSNSFWYNSGTTLTFGGGTYPFSGSIQEIRLWSNYLSESTFDSHVLNPESIEGNYTSSAYNDLTARFSLGNNLYTSNHSIVTTTASVAPDQTIQGWTASFANFPNTNNYSNFVEKYYADVANSGYANPVTDKVRIYSGSEYGTQLLPNKSIEVPPLIPITKDIHLLDAGLSPQDEINKDIIAQLGSTYDLDNMIGDPRGFGYDELDKLRTEYFKKYINKYNYKDFITLIEYFHNSLFRTLKDFTPARTNPATGIIIKNHLLERPIQTQYSPSASRHEQSGSIDLLAITASNAMVATQPTYSYTINTNLGPVNLMSDSRDFFVGVFPSSSIFIHDDFDLNNFNPFAIGFDNDKTSSYSQSIWNVEFNPLLNNVSQNQISSIRKKLTLIGGDIGFTSGSVYVTESIQLQDFTYNYVRHANPRYDGSTTTSTKYNIYSTGDATFGKNASIDKNTTQFAFISEIVVTGSDFIAMPERSNVYIKYLIDRTGSLTELSKRNYDTLTEDQKFNLYQVQNIFKSGETVNISLFDYQNPTNQINLDGNKSIFAGGYKFHPVLWRTGSESLIYTLNSDLYPQGVISSSIYSPSNFNLIWGTSGNPNYGTLQGYVRVTTKPLSPPFNLPNYTVSVDTFVSMVVTLREESTGITTNQSLTLTIPSGQNASNNQFFPGFRVLGVIITSINTPGNAGLFILGVLDSDPSLILNPSDPTIISASYSQSFYYGGYGGFNLSGSIENNTSSYYSIDYKFEVNKGDLLRLASGSTFTPLLEYEVVEIIRVPLNQGSGSLVFRVDRPVKDVATGSYSISGSTIPRYVFSRKIPDETNIVIQHRKNPGETSAGLAKNNNLLPEIDANMANITSDLKNKVFGTVFIP